MSRGILTASHRGRAEPRPTQKPYREHFHYGRRVGWLHRYGYYIGTLVLIPMFSIIESLGVIYGLLRPNIGGFHVVDK